VALPDTENSVGCCPASERETLQLRFASHYVTISSSSPEVTADFRSSVELMLESRLDGICAGKLQVTARTGTFRVLGPAASDAYECDDPEAAANRLFHAAIKLLMAARSDLLWIHGGVAARARRAMLLCGTSGAGKSTLVAALLARGWTYFSDEFAVVDPRTATVFPFPIALYKRVSNGQSLAKVEDIQQLPKIFIETPAHAVGRGPVPIGGVFFLSYTPRAEVVQVVDCSPAEGVLEMLKNSLSTAPAREQEIRRLCDLMSRVPSARLSYAHARDASDRIDARFARSQSASLAVAQSRRDG